MTDKRISVIIFGTGESLKKALITIILGKDLSEVPQSMDPEPFKIETYKNDTYEFKCAADTPQIIDTKSEYKQSHDMHLLVVKEGFSEEDVWQQIEDLSKKTGTPTEKFKVVLPLRYKPENHSFKSYTMQQLFSDLDNLAAQKSSRSDDEPESKNQKNEGDRCSNHPLIEPKERLKRNHTGTKVNLVLLGMAGTGKSASGNTILRKKVFISKPCSNQVTTECQVEETEINGTHVRVIDTPDIFDDDIEPSVRDKHVKRCRELCEAGTSVFVLVMHVSRFTDGERDVLRKLEKAFGSKVRDQTVILFTRGNDLQQADMSLEDFLHSCQPDLKEIIQKCGNRCALFDHKSSDSNQVEKLMQTVMRMIQ